MASRASVGSIDVGLSATAYALAQTSEDKHAIALKAKNGTLGWEVGVDGGQGLT